MLLELKDELERNLYIDAVVKIYRGRYGISSEDLRKRVNTLALKGTPAEHRTQPKSGSPEKRKRSRRQTLPRSLCLPGLSLIRRYLTR